MVNAVRVRCPTCHRAEVWAGPTPTVELPGGARKPAVHPEIASWRILAAARAGETGPVVAECPVCGLPMVAEKGADLPFVPWTLHTKAGDVLVTADRIDGATDAAALTARLEQDYGWKLEIKPLSFLFQGGLVVFGALPIFLLWVWAVVFTSWFLINFFRS